MGSGAPRPASPRWSARSSAACSSTASAGSGSSSSTSRSASSVSSSPGGWCPRLATHPHRFDSLGVALSAVGMFLLVFGIQEGETVRLGHHHRAHLGAAAHRVGLVVLGVFVWWQALNTASRCCRCRSSATATSRWPTSRSPRSGFSVTAMAFPLMFYAQVVRGLSPDPVGAAARADGRDLGRAGARGRPDVDRVHPRYITAAGLLPAGLAVLADAGVMTPDAAVWLLLLPMALLGVANAGMWAPLARHGHPQPAAAVRPGPAPGSTTPPARSAPSSAVRRSPRSSRHG